jgi:hypothetical protein
VIPRNNLLDSRVPSMAAFCLEVDLVIIDSSMFGSNWLNGLLYRSFCEAAGVCPPNLVTTKSGLLQNVHLLLYELVIDGRGFSCQPQWLGVHSQKCG